MNTEPTKAKRTEDDFALPADFDDAPKSKRSDAPRSSGCGAEWNTWKSTWHAKRGAWQVRVDKPEFRTHGGSALSIQLNDGRTFNLSLGKLIFGVVLLVLLPFKLVLFAALFGAMVFFGNRGRMMGWGGWNGGDSADKPKRTERDTITMV